MKREWFMIQQVVTSKGDPQFQAKELSVQAKAMLGSDLMTSSRIKHAR